jgi:hypothetical protein
MFTTEVVLTEFLNALATKDPVSAPLQLKWPKSS